MILRGAISISLLIFTQPAPACEVWNVPIQVGSLPANIISEASGLAMSILNPKRLYHVDDGRLNNHLYSTQVGDSHVFSAVVRGFEPRNLEAVTVGKCGQEICVFMGDIGDNKSKRPDLQIAIFTEKASATTEIVPMNIAEIFFPDGSHNAEAMLIWRDRLYLFTKDSKPISRVYSIEVGKLMRSKKELELRFDGEISLLDWPSHSPKKAKFNITDAAIDSKGEEIFFLTQTDLYRMQAEELLNLRKGFSPKVKWNSLQSLQKQEGIAVNPVDGSFYVSSETDGESVSEILKYECSR